MANEGNSIILNSKGHRVEAFLVASVIAAGGLFPGSILEWAWENNELKFTAENPSGDLDTLQKMVLIESSLIGGDYKSKTPYYGTAICMMRGDTAWCVTNGIAIDAGGIGTSCRANNGDLVAGIVNNHSVDIAKVIGLGKTIGTQNWHPVQFY